MSNIENALIKAKSEEKKGIIRGNTDDLTIVPSDIKQMREVEPIDNAILDELKIIHQEMKNKDIYNEFRALRTLILQKIQRANTSILIYSTMPGGGSSYISANLGAAIALDNKKTALLLNCDFKSPAEYEKLLPDKTGLIDYLSDEIGIDKIIHPTGIKRLRVIPSGDTRYSFSEYFTSGKLKELFSEIKMRYSDRSIIVDSPPASEVADIKLLMEEIDYALLVVPFGKNNVETVMQAFTGSTVTRECSFCRKEFTRHCHNHDHLWNKRNRK